MGSSSLQERVTIQEMARAGLSDPRIAAQLHVSPATVRKWRRRGQRQGSAGLFSKMGRPVKGELSTFPAEMRDTLSTWRKEHPGWGPKTLRAELKRCVRFQGQKSPSRAVIARWLKAQGLSRAYRHTQELPSPAVSSALACHEEWEMDGRGYQRIAEAGVD